MFSCFYTIPERHGRMDRQMDRQTDLLYQYRASVYGCAVKTSSINAKTCHFITVYKACSKVAHKTTKSIYYHLKAEDIIRLYINHIHSPWPDEKIFLLLYVGAYHFAVGLTCCYKIAGFLHLCELISIVGKWQTLVCCRWYSGVL